MLGDGAARRLLMDVPDHGSTAGEAMMRLSDIKIGWKLYLGFGMVLLLVVALATYCVMSLNRLDALEHDLGVLDAEYAAAMTLMRAELDIAVLTSEAALEGDIDELREGIETWRPIMEEAFVATTGHTAHAEEGHGEDVAVQPVFEEYLAAVEADLIPAVAAGVQGEELSAIHEGTDEIRVTLQEALNELAADTQLEVTEKSEEFDGVLEGMIRVLYIVVPIILLVGLAIAAVTTRSITGPLESVVTVTQRLAQGDLSFDIKALVRTRSAPSWTPWARWSIGCATSLWTSKRSPRM